MKTRKVYLLQSNLNNEVIAVFGTIKKAHIYLKENRHPVHRTFVNFKKWVDHYGKYEISEHLFINIHNLY